jgi:hypothetical protein
MRHNKRGGIAITTLIELAIVAVLTIAFLSATGLITNEEGILDLYIARDVSRITSALMSTPYDVAYTYPQSFDKVIFVEGNEITVAQNESFFVSGKPLVYTRARYLSSALFGAMSSVVLDASFFSINKIGTKILFVNGRLNQEKQKQLEKLIGTSSFQKEQVVVDVEVIPGYLNENAVLQELKTLILSNLNTQGFKTSELNPQEQTTLVLVFSFTDSARSTIQYSSYAKTQTQPLAEELQRLLANQIILAQHPFEELQEGRVAKIHIELSSRDHTLLAFEELKAEDKGMKNVFTKRVVLALENFYT